MHLRDRRRESVDKIEVLSRIPLFSSSTHHELAKAAALFDEVSRPAGTLLVREGVPGNEFYVLVDGSVTASVNGETLATLTSGDFFGEMSLLENAPRAATIRADTDVTILVADPRGFAALWATAPGVGVRMLRTMSSRLRSVEASAHH
jgi:CRP/FNR family transcriptional regulator, cyclic AMP receptor protein